MEDLSKHNLPLTRTLDAPLERVWQAWTDPDQVQQWWGPRGVTNPTCQWEANPGGRIDVVMLAGEELGPLAGQEWPMTGQFITAEPERKLIFTSSAIVNGEEVLQNHCTVTFEDQDGKTLLTVQIEIVKATPEAAGPLAGMETGWNQSLDKLTEFLS